MFEHPEIIIVYNLEADPEYQHFYDSIVTLEMLHFALRDAANYD